MVNLNELSAKCYANALKRGKISEMLDYGECYIGLLEEFNEYVVSSEKDPSKHLPQYTEAVEELADILLVCMTELHRRGVNVEEIVKAKITFNENRV